MSDEIQIKINGLSDFVGAIEKLQASLDAATRSATVQAGKTLRVLAVSNFNQPPAPFTRTGNLQRSIKSHPVVQQGRGRYSITVAPTAVYSRIIELGGSIVERRAGWLAVIRHLAKSPGQFVKRGDDVPGSYLVDINIKPHPYFTPAYRTMVKKMNDIFSTAWRKALES